MHRFSAFVKLGVFLKEYCEYSKNPIELTGIKKQWFDDFQDIIALSGHKNGWYSKENVLYCIESWANLLTEDSLKTWLENYNLDNIKAKNVAVIMAGNIPLVGFHDFLCTLITGNSIIIKTATDDDVLLPFLAKYLISIDSDFNEIIQFSKERLQNFDCVIATGSNNTARYFEHYFGNKPNIIRKNRNSVAVLTGNETQEQLFALGEDIFRYYGLGCRSVSKLLVPKDYDFDTFFKAIFPYNDIVNENKYANNYDYNKAVYLMSEFKILDNGFLILKEDKSYASPIASLFYERYTSIEGVVKQLVNDREKLQCIVSDGIHKDEIPFGQTQTPSLNNYADDVDTVDFLLRT